MIRRKILGAVATAGLVVLFAACDGGAGDSLMGPDVGLASDDLSASSSNSDNNSNDSSGSSSSDDGSDSNSSGPGELRLRCEVRTDELRSKISVDGKNLASGQYRARVRSGNSSAMSGLRATVGDEVEFDFDSDPDDIAAGATAIVPDFIQISSTPDVVAEILSAGGQVVVSQAGDCSVRR
jgi:hypothetical protein